MPHDLTIQLLIQPKDHHIGDGLRRAARHRSGDVLDVWPVDKFAELVDGRYHMTCNMGQPMFGYLHVRKAPNKITIESLKDIFTAPIVGSPHALDQEVRVLRARECYICLAELPQDLRVEFDERRELTIAWSLFKSISYSNEIVKVYDPGMDKRLDIEWPI